MQLRVSAAPPDTNTRIATGASSASMSSGSRILLAGVSRSSSALSDSRSFLLSFAPLSAAGSGRHPRQLAEATRRAAVALSWLSFSPLDAIALSQLLVLYLL